MAKTPSCPRCGYDLSGIISSWTSSCPLTGICSECGLEFQWRYLLDPRFKIKPWFFEHALRRHVRSFLYTLWRSLRPWSFWRWVRMEDRTDARRVWMTIIFGTTCIEGVVAIFVLALAMVTGLLVEWSHPWWGGLPHLMTSAICPVFGSYGELHELWLLPLVAVLLTCAMGPGLLVLFGPSFRIARVKRSHLMRVWAYSLLHIPLVYSFFSIATVIRTVLLVFFEPYWLGSASTGPEHFAEWFKEWGGAVAGGFGVLWFALYLRYAVGRYLRLPASRSVAISIGIIMGLFAAVFAVALWFVLAQIRPNMAWGW